MRNATAKRAPLGMCLARVPAWAGTLTATGIRAADYGLADNTGEDHAVRIRFCGFSLRGRRFLCRA